LGRTRPPATARAYRSAAAFRLRHAARRSLGSDARLCGPKGGGGLSQRHGYLRRGWRQRAGLSLFRSRHVGACRNLPTASFVIGEVMTTLPRTFWPTAASKTIETTLGRRCSIIRFIPRAKPSSDCGGAINNCIEILLLCNLQRIGKIGDVRRFVYQWITIFFLRFCPARGDRSRSVSAQIRGRISHLYSGSSRRAISRRLSYCGQTCDLARTYPAPG